MNLGNILVSFGSCILVLLLILCGLLLIVVPPPGRRMLQKTAAFAGVFLVVLFALNALWQILRSINPFFLIMGMIAVSALAYFLREHRLGCPERRAGPRHAERTPVMPHHIGGEDE